MLKFSQIVHLILLTVLFTGPLVGSANAEEYVESGKKHSWFSFNKPKKTSPAEQMLYAQNLLKNNKTKKAVKAFRALVNTWPGSAEAPMAQWAFAKILDTQGKEQDAFDEYQVLMENYTGRFPNYDQVLNRQFEIATNIMVKKKGGFFFGGFDAPERAIPYLEKVVENGPRSPHASKAQYLIGEAYEKSYEYELAVVAYISTLHRYPLSPLAEDAAFGRARVLNTISSKYPNDVEALNEAWVGIMVFLRAYPESKFTEEAIAIRDNLLTQKAKHAYKIAAFYDKRTKHPKAALESYEAFVQQYPKSQWTDLAKKRIVQLSESIEGSKK